MRIRSDREAERYEREETGVGGLSFGGGLGTMASLAKGETKIEVALRMLQGLSHAWSSCANFKWGKLPHTGGITLHQQISVLTEETMMSGFEM
jgi:hypothetical protein